MLDLITCEECVKEDVCQYKTEYKETTKLHCKDRENSGSPIYVIVGCASCFKNANTRSIPRTDNRE